MGEPLYAEPRAPELSGCRTGCRTAPEVTPEARERLMPSPLDNV